MAILRPERQQRRFSLGAIEFYAAIKFELRVNQKLVPYDYAFSPGIDYDALGEGEVSVMLQFIADEWTNIGNDKVGEIRDLEQLMKIQLANNQFKFVHPELLTLDVLIQDMQVSQRPEDNSYDVTVNLKKVTRVNSSFTQNTQETLEENFDARIIDRTDTYTVKDGDTLWDIAANTYGDGRLWRKIWDFGDNKTRNQGGDLFEYYPDVPTDSSIYDLLEISEDPTEVSAAAKRISDGVGSSSDQYVVDLAAGNIQTEPTPTSNPDLIFPGDTFVLPKLLS